FVFEAIATGANEILARFTMPKGYYLYRDKTSFALADGGGATLGAPRWPAGKTHTDENFGTTTVYYDQVEVPLAVTRSHAAAHSVTVQTRLQGCLENSICYPVSERSVRVDLPAGGAGSAAAAASASFASAANDAAGTSDDSRFAAALGRSLGFVFVFFFVAG